MERIASVLAPALRADDEAAATRRLATALLAGSPRVMVAEPGLCRADARGWERRGGEEALGRELLAAARREGWEAAVGMAEAAVPADVAAAVAWERANSGSDSRSGSSPDSRSGSLPLLIVPSGEARSFLAPLPPRLLPLSSDLEETLRALGVRRVGQIAARDRSELEARFGPEGLRLHRWSRGEDRRRFRPLAPDDSPEARMEMDGSVRTAEPLLFVLRRLLARLCDDLAEEGRCVRRLRLRIDLEEGGGREVEVAPARPTRREDLLFDLCRAGLERTAEDGRLPAAVAALAVRVVERAAADVRQEDLFAERHRDPVAAAGALSRIRARLGEGAVVRPARRADHRPESRNAWAPADPGSTAHSAGSRTADPAESPRGGSGGAGEDDATDGVEGDRSDDSADGEDTESALPCVLRLLPEPEEIRVEPEEGPPEELWDGEAWHGLVAAEGPERISGDWWQDPYRREYYRVFTEGGELLWLFREWRRGETPGWKLHGWWD